MYTFEPKQKFAKANGRNMRISTRKAAFICKVIRRKPLSRAKRLLTDLNEGKRNLEGKYYTKTVGQILHLLESCEKNAEFLGLDNDKLFVHASAHQGTTMQRRRRKSAFGSRMKETNMEIMLIERGKLVDKVPKEKIKKQEEKENDKNMDDIKNLKIKAHELQDKVDAEKERQKESEKKEE